MAKITFEYPIKDVCGKLDKSSRIIFAHLGDSKFTRMQGSRKTPVTSAELEQRAKFTRVSKATRARLNDPALMAADQAAFANQSEHKTLYQYVFNQVWNADKGE